MSTQTEFYAPRKPTTMTMTVNVLIRNFASEIYANPKQTFFFEKVILVRHGPFDIQDRGAWTFGTGREILSDKIEARLFFSPTFFS